jgi:hypothetical protein
MLNSEDSGRRPVISETARIMQPGCIGKCNRHQKVSENALRNLFNYTERLYFVTFLGGGFPMRKIAKLWFALAMCGLVASVTVGVHKSAAQPCPNNKCQ